jgi:hypothetical protein
LFVPSKVMVMDPWAFVVMLVFLKNGHATSTSGGD